MDSDALPTSSRCMGLPSGCGVNGDANCCETATVPGGTFYRSYDVASDMAYSDMSYPATVSTFVLDKYEVTVGRFRAFVNAGMGTQASPPATGSGAHPKLTGSGWDSAWNTNLVTTPAALVSALKCDAESQTWTDAPEVNENVPINCVTWYEAMAFCIWDGGRLPTEAEWNYAASGGNEQRAYPWSNPASSTVFDCSYANCTNLASRVGSKSPKGDGRWGHSDLGGNVREWAIDLYATYQVPCSDCANLTTGSNHVTRGGSIIYVEGYMRTASRSHALLPSHRADYLGLRCARTL